MADIENQTGDLIKKDIIIQAKSVRIKARHKRGKNRIIYIYIFNERGRKERGGMDWHVLSSP